MPSESFCIYQQENLVIGHKMIFGAKKVSPVVQSSVYRQPTSRCLSSAKRTYLWGVAVCAHTNSPAQQSVTWHHVAYACAQQHRRASAGRCRLQIWNRLSLKTARSLPKTVKKRHGEFCRQICNWCWNVSEGKGSSWRRLREVWGWVVLIKTYMFVCMWYLSKVRRGYSDRYLRSYPY